MKKTISILALLCFVFAAGPAFAVSLWLTPSSQTISQGGTASVNLVVGGLGNYEPPDLGAFSLDIGYDPSILSFSSVVFGDPTLGDLVDVTGVGTAFSDGSVWGTVHLDEVSFDDPGTLTSAQPSAFILATLNFIGLSMGTSGLDFLSVSLSDAYGFAFSDVTSAGAEAAVVPLPASLLLLAPGLIGIAALRKRLYRS